jgi:hypothetical protein
MVAPGTCSARKPAAESTAVLQDGSREAQPPTLQQAACMKASGFNLLYQGMKRPGKGGNAFAYSMLHPLQTALYDCTVWQQVDHTCSFTIVGVL